jgi:hypothetical protein
MSQDLIIKEKLIRKINQADNLYNKIKNKLHVVSDNKLIKKYSRRLTTIDDILIRLHYSRREQHH